MRFISIILTHTFLIFVLSVLKVQAAGSSLQGRGSASGNSNQKLEDAKKAKEEITSKMRVMYRGKAENLKSVTDVKIGKGWKSYIPRTQDYKYRQLKIQGRKQDERIRQLEQGTSHQSSHSQHSSGFGSPHDRQGSASPGSHTNDHHFPKPTALNRNSSGSSSGSSNGSRSLGHGHDQRDKRLVELSNKKGEPIRQGGKDLHAGKSTSPSFADKGKGKAINRSPTLVHTGFASDSTHSGSHDKNKEELYAYQNSQSLPVHLGKQLKEAAGLGSFSFRSPAHSEGGYLAGGSSHRSVGKSSVNSAQSSKAGALSPVGKNIERRLKGFEGEHKDALRKILVMGTGIKASEKVYKNQEKVQEIDQKLLEKHRPAKLSAVSQYVPKTLDWDKRKAKQSHDRNLKKMENLVQDVSVHAEKGKMGLNVLTEIGEITDAENQNRAMLKHDKMHSSSRPPRHPQSTTSASRNQPALPSPSSSHPHGYPTSQHESHSGSNRFSDSSRST